MFDGQPLDEELVKSAFSITTKRIERPEEIEKWDEISQGDKFDSSIRLGNSFAATKGLSQLPVAFVNGIPAETGSTDEVIPRETFLTHS